jgi:peptidyl-dipeptidase A
MKRETQMGRLRLLLWAVLMIAAAGIAAASSAAATPTAEEAREFVEAADKRLLDLWIRRARAAWVAATYITGDTEKIAADAQEVLTGVNMDLAAGATRFRGLKLPEDVARKLLLLRLGSDPPAPPDPAERSELATIMASLEADYGRGRYCPQGDKGECLDINALSRILAASREPEKLLDAWRGWHAIGPPMRQRYERFAELVNRGSKELGFDDYGHMWRSQYDMTPEAFAAETERLWQQVRPLYEALHAHVRAALSKKYGPELVPQDGLIPAHLLGNMWAQQWGNIYELAAPPEGNGSVDLTAILKARKLDEREMVRYGERFFTSLGFDPLPATFWERSQFVKPADHDVVCHASAWDLDFDNDLRIKMCIEINEEDFETIHHELGHNIYQRAYRLQPTLFRDSANQAFHEAIGDTIALSVTPAYLKKVGLLDGQAPAGGATAGGTTADGSLAELMRMALDKVAFLPFGLILDQWRWKVFSGEVPPEDYNKAWWALREQYQGVRAPLPRSESDFDPGAKYHIPANTSYTRYFLAHILQFQIHRSLCRQAGFTGPLHECSIYDNKAVGEKLGKMLEMGQSRPWPEALAALTGERKMDATAILDYFAPLKKWLDEQNRGRKVGF